MGLGDRLDRRHYHVGVDVLRDGSRYSDKARSKRGDHEEFPRQTAYNVPLELVLTTLPVLIVMGLFFFNVQTQDVATALNKNPKVTVDVTAYQWNWKFGYAEVDGELTKDGQKYIGKDEEAQKRAEFSRYEGATPNGNEHYPTGQFTASPRTTTAT